MKTLIRWSAALALAGGIFLGSLFADQSRAFALSDEQVIEQLRTVPVFTVMSGEGNILLVTPEGEETPVATVFMSHQSAEAFLASLRETDPETAGNAQLLILSLADIYQLALENQENPLRIAIIPVQEEVEAARTVLQENGENPEEFQGVPLFYPAGTEDGVLLTQRQGDEEIIPMFFEREQLDQWLSQIQQTQPDIVANVRVRVGTLERLIQNLQASEDQELTRIYLVPSEESAEFIRSLQPTEGQTPEQPQQTPPEQPNQ
ncbi:MAG: hypothetical protein HC769_06810 [Cyanobacteria bacterium CRU_2_1]|nr:hypothetical protein [Cyanobacteria bacterium RU_5_0]NJR58586.1 hypothetical protein [Cyanobacteria bacterium CRU_2_1]